jgi:peptidoglycan/xylan/chitin deacetylase (PgdA/CDA1 family)
MSLTIVMYHYVRDLRQSSYPAIKGRDLFSFQRQLDYIGCQYTLVTAEQVIAAIKDGEPFPENAAWLTFDDGYSDHYSFVFPLLKSRGWQGSFFPPVRAVRDGQLLDVNRVHFILASSPSPEAIVTAISEFIQERNGSDMLRSFEEYWTELARPSRMDSAEVVFIKRILQFGLPEKLRTELAAQLFARFVSKDPVAFAADLYVTPDHLREMINGGMHVGSHTANHSWLDRLDQTSQAKEIDSSLAFMEALGVPTHDWVISYPFGAYNDSLLALLKDRGCAVGLTTKVGVAQLGSDDPLTLPRLDTNDLPS